MASYQVMKTNFKRAINNKLFFIITLILPIIIILLGQLMNGLGSKSYQIGLIGRSVNEVMNSGEEQEDIYLKIADESNIKSDLITGKYHYIVRYDNSKNSYEVISNGSKAQKVYYQRQYEDILNGNYRVNNEVTNENKEVRLFNLVLMMIMVTSTMLAGNLLKDRINGTLMRFRLSSNGILKYLLGNIGYTFIISLLQVMISVGLLNFIFKAIRLSSMDFISVTIIIAFVGSTFGTFIVSISKNELMANILASAVTVLLSFVSGMFVAIETMPNVLKSISIISPLRWLRDLVVKLVNQSSYLKEMVVLLCVIVVPLGVSVMINNLKYKEVN